MDWLVEDNGVEIDINYQKKALGTNKWLLFAVKGHLLTCLFIKLDPIRFKLKHQNTCSGLFNLLFEQTHGIERAS